MTRSHNNSSIANLFSSNLVKWHVALATWSFINLPMTSQLILLTSSYTPWKAIDRVPTIWERPTTLYMRCNSWWLKQNVQSCFTNVEVFATKDCISSSPLIKVKVHLIQIRFTFSDKWFEINNVIHMGLSKLDQIIYCIQHGYHICSASIISHSKSNFKFFFARGSLCPSMAIFVMILLYSKTCRVGPKMDNHLVFTFLNNLFLFVSKQVASF